jgi:hypothetical protein
VELLHDIGSYLDNRDLHALASSSRRMRRALLPQFHAAQFERARTALVSCSTLRRLAVCISIVTQWSAEDRPDDVSLRAKGLAELPLSIELGFEPEDRRPAFELLLDCVEGLQHAGRALLLVETFNAVEHMEDERHWLYQEAARRVDALPILLQAPVRVRQLVACQHLAPEDRGAALRICRARIAWLHTALEARLAGLSMFQIQERKAHLGALIRLCAVTADPAGAAKRCLDIVRALPPREGGDMLDRWMDQTLPGLQDPDRLRLARQGCEVASQMPGGLLDAGTANRVLRAISDLQSPAAPTLEDLCKVLSLYGKAKGEVSVDIDALRDVLRNFGDDETFQAALDAISQWLAQCPLTQLSAERVQRLLAEEEDRRGNEAFDPV